MEIWTKGLCIFSISIPHFKEKKSHWKWQINKTSKRMVTLAKEKPYTKLKRIEPNSTPSSEKWSNLSHALIHSQVWCKPVCPSPAEPFLLCQPEPFPCLWPQTKSCNNLTDKGGISTLGSLRPWKVKWISKLWPVCGVWDVDIPGRELQDFSGGSDSAVWVQLDLQQLWG